MNKASMLILTFILGISISNLGEASGPPISLSAETTAGNAQEAYPKGKTLAVKVAGTPVYTNKATQNTRNEVESAITALKVNGTDYTVGAYMRQINGVWRVNTLASTAVPPTLFSWTRRTPTLPANHMESVDPVLDVNPYTSGVGIQRVYLAGLTYALSSSNKRTAPSSIVVWRSTDGGFNWSSPTTVATAPFVVDGAMDKPDIAVSWFLKSRGYVYVAYILAPSPSPVIQPNKIFVARSTDGGLTFGTPVQLAEAVDIEAPQIVVSSNTGKVYVLWTDLVAQRIRMVSSTYNNFQSWTTQPPIVPTGTLLGPGATIHADTPCTSGIQAVTVPQARYNWVTGSIGLVWHDKSGSTTNVYYAGFNGTYWTAPKKIDSVSSSDQWMPSVDFDNTGEYLVVFFDRKSDEPQNLLYRERWAKIDSQGKVVASGYVSGAFDSDPTEADVNITTSICFKGEYQDVWYWPYSAGGRFHAIWTGHPSTDSNDNVYVSGIQ